MSQTDRLDGLTGSVAIKQPCRVGTTANITLSGEQTIDGVAVVTDDRVVVKNQTDGTENGIWIADTGDWVRSPDFDGNRDVVQGTLVNITAGSTLANTYWRVSTANPIVIDTTSITLTQALNISNALTAADIGVSVQGYDVDTAKTDVAQTWTANQTLGENIGIYFDAALSADGKYSGIVTDGTAGAALAFGELCYLQTSDSRWEKSQAAAAQIATANLRLGMCVLAAAADGDPTKMLVLGKIRADSLFPTMTIGASVYMSAATAGVITSTAPTGTTDFTVRKIGFANTADELFFQPSNDYVTLA